MANNSLWWCYTIFKHHRFIICIYADVVFCGLLENKHIIFTHQSRTSSIIRTNCKCHQKLNYNITISRLAALSSLKITNHSFQYTAPHLWNQLLESFHEHHHIFRLLVTSCMSITTLSIRHLFFFTLDLKLTSSSSHFHHRLLHR